MSSANASRPTPRNQLSFSRVKTYFQCPRRYRLRYLKGMREAFRSIETYLGNTVHAVLEWLYRERDLGTVPDEDAVLECLARKWQEDWHESIAVVRINEPPSHYLRLGRSMLSQYYNCTLTKDESTTLGLEQRLSHQLANGMCFTGIVDRVGRTATGRLFVVDYKTSKSTGDGSDFSEGLQAPLYATLLMQRYDEPEALAGYHYLRHSCTSWRRLSQDDGSQVLHRFETLADQAVGAAEFPPSPGILCAWCGFNHLCDAAQVPPELAGGLQHARQR